MGLCHSQCVGYDAEAVSFDNVFVRSKREDGTSALKDVDVHAEHDADLLIARNSGIGDEGAAARDSSASPVGSAHVGPRKSARFLDGHTVREFEKPGEAAVISFPLDNLCASISTFRGSARSVQSTKSFGISAKRLGRLPSFIDPNKGLRDNKSVSSMPGQVRDIYEVECVVGEGAFGTVSRVKSKVTGTLFALKSIPVQNVPSRDDFLRELKIARQLRHPYIVELHQTFEDPEAYHLVMDLCTGGDTLDKVNATIRDYGGGYITGGLETDVVGRYMWQMLNGIAYLHNYRFAHRDVKPENYLLVDPSRSAAIKLIDFGLGKSFKEGEKMKSKVGTAAYVAPEVVFGEDGYDEKCDIWSIGAVVFVLACAAPPFPGEDEDAILEKVRKGDVDFSDSDWDKHPEKLKDLIRRLLRKNPGERPRAEVLLQFDDYLQKCQQPAAAPGCCTVQ